MAASFAAAHRYADAYYALAKDHADVDRWRRELAAAVEILCNPEVASAMVNPRVRPRERTDLVLDLLDGAAPSVRNLVRLLIERSRTTLARRILENFDARADRDAGIVRAEVTSAVPLTRESQQSVTAALRQNEGGDVRTVALHDPAILGGLVMRIGERIIDDSIRTRLQQLQAALA